MTPAWQLGGCANAAGNDFPLQNLPFAVFRRKGSVKPSGWRSHWRPDSDMVRRGSGAFTGVAATARKRARKTSSMP